MRFLKHLDKLEVIVATGLPGAYKVIIFYILQRTYNLDVLGQLASWQSIAQIIGFFTAIGWSTLILVRVSKANSKNQELEVFNNLTRMALVTLFCFCFLIYIFSEILDFPDFLQIIFWLVAWTSYQIPRHYWVSIKKYREIIFLDSFIILMSLFLIVMELNFNISKALAFVMFFSGLCSYLFIVQGKVIQRTRFVYEMKGLEFGLINLLSGGIAMTIVPLSRYFESEQFAGLVSLYLALISIALLVPRAISLYQLPLVSKNMGSVCGAGKVVRVMHRQISFSNIVCFGVSIFTAWILFLYAPIKIQSYTLSFVLILLAFQNLIITYSLTYATILASKEDSGYQLRVNIISFMVYIAAIFFISLNEMGNSIVYVCVMTCFIGFYRYLLYKNKTKKYFIIDSV